MVLGCDWKGNQSNFAIMCGVWGGRVAGWQGGRVVRVLDFESVGPGFESHSEHFMDLFHGSPEL